MLNTITGVVTNGVVVPNSPLPEGAKVEVFVVGPEKAVPQFRSALEFLESLPSGPRTFKTWGEYDQHLRNERNSWSGQANPNDPNEKAYFEELARMREEDLKRTLEETHGTLPPG